MQSIHATDPIICSFSINLNPRWAHRLRISVQESSRLNSSNSISPDPSVSILLMSSSMSIVRPKLCLMICGRDWGPRRD